MIGEANFGKNPPVQGKGGMSRIEKIREKNLAKRVNQNPEEVKDEIPEVGLGTPEKRSPVGWIDAQIKALIIRRSLAGKKGNEKRVEELTVAIEEFNRKREELIKNESII